MRFASLVILTVALIASNVLRILDKNLIAKQSETLMMQSLTIAKQDHALTELLTATKNLEAADAEIKTRAAELVRKCGMIINQTKKENGNKWQK